MPFMFYLVRASYLSDSTSMLISAAHVCILWAIRVAFVRYFVVLVVFISVTLVVFSFRYMV